MKSLPLSPQLKTAILSLALFLASCATQPEPVQVEEITNLDTNLASPSTLIESPNTLCSNDDDMRFYNYFKLVPKDIWYTHPDLKLGFKYDGPDNIYFREKLPYREDFVTPSLLFSQEDEAECVRESIDNFSTEIRLESSVEVSELKKNLLQSGALPEEQLSYGEKVYSHIRAFNFGNGIADFYFKDQGEKTYIFTFTWLHEGEAGLSREEITKARGEDPLPDEYKMILDTLEISL